MYLFLYWSSLYLLQLARVSAITIIRRNISNFKNKNFHIKIMTIKSEKRNKHLCLFCHFFYAFCNIPIFKTFQKAKYVWELWRFDLYQRLFPSRGVTNEKQHLWARADDRICGNGVLLAAFLVIPELRQNYGWRKQSCKYLQVQHIGDFLDICTLNWSWQCQLKRYLPDRQCSTQSTDVRYSQYAYISPYAPVWETWFFFIKNVGYSDLWKFTNSLKYLQKYSITLKASKACVLASAFHSLILWLLLMNRTILYTKLDAPLHSTLPLGD